MSQNELKLSVAKAALNFLVDDSIVGVGTGSTVNFFIDELAKMKHRIKATVSSSVASAKRLEEHGINVLDLNDVLSNGSSIPVYIDGADEITKNGEMIKGGGGALTREKIIASVAERFVCIADESKSVDVLGKFPLPVEVVPMAYRAVMKELDNLGGKTTLRMNDVNKPFITDNGNFILDTEKLNIVNPIELETYINNIVGVVTVGLFAHRKADVCLLGTRNGVKTFIL